MKNLIQKQPSSRLITRQTKRTIAKPAVSTPSGVASVVSSLQSVKNHGKTFSCMFENCAKKYASSGSLSTHIKNKHPEVKLKHGGHNKKPTPATPLVRRPVGRPPKPLVMSYGFDEHVARPPLAPLPIGPVHRGKPVFEKSSEDSTPVVAPDPIIMPEAVVLPNPDTVTESDAEVSNSDLSDPDAISGPCFVSKTRKFGLMAQDTYTTLEPH